MTDKAAYAQASGSDAKQPKRRQTALSTSRSVLASKNDGNIRQVHSISDARTTIRQADHDQRDQMLSILRDIQQRIYTTSSAAPTTPKPWLVPDALSVGLSRELATKQYSARFMCDIECPDGALVTSNSVVSKVTRLRNDGAVAWPQGTQVLWTGGYPLHGGTVHSIAVPPACAKQDVDVVIKFTAPSTPGRCVAYYRLATPQGEYFGHELWVEIEVV
jgi:hypothetical protein